MTREELINNLIQEARNEVSRQNCRFSADSETQLREFVTSGVDRMTVAERYNSLRIAEAQRNIRHFCVQISEQTKKENRYWVENRTFSSARLSLCPLWPFC